MTIYQTKLGEISVTEIYVENGYYKAENPLFANVCYYKVTDQGMTVVTTSKTVDVYTIETMNIYGWDFTRETCSESEFNYWHALAMSHSAPPTIQKPFYQRIYDKVKEIFSAN